MAEHAAVHYNGITQKQKNHFEKTPEQCLEILDELGVGKRFHIALISGNLNVKKNPDGSIW